MIPSTPVSICLSTLRSEVTGNKVPSLCYCVAKQCALKVATEGVLSTDWRIALESLDLFAQISRLKITDELPDPYAKLVSTDVKVRQKKLSECCAIVAAAQQNVNVPFFVAAGVRSRRDGDWRECDDFEPHTTSPDLLEALLSKGHGFKAIEEATLCEVLANSDRITRHAAIPTIQGLVNNNHVSNAMVEALTSYLTSDQNPDFPINASKILNSYLTLMIPCAPISICLSTLHSQLSGNKALSI